MALPLLDYAPTTQNQRVQGFEVPGDEYPRAYSLDCAVTETEIDAVIWAAYRQIYNEQQLLIGNRQSDLESQLRAGQITVREFVRGLVLSEPFRRRNYESNNNYRFVQMCVQRVLGREVYGENEKYAWSIVLATKGLEGFIDALLESEEYLENFGDFGVPYQRRRILPQRDRGEVSFAHFPRYGSDRLAQLKALGYFDETFRGWDGRGQFWQRLTAVRPTRWAWQKPPYTRAYQRIARWAAYGIAGGLGLLTLSVALAAWGILPL